MIRLKKFSSFLIEAKGWKRDYAGSYTHKDTGWRIEKSNNHKGWNVINPKTGRVFDSHPTKKEAFKWHGDVSKEDFKEEKLTEYLKDKPNTIDTPDWAEAKFKEQPKSKPGISVGKPNKSVRKDT